MNEMETVAEEIINMKIDSSVVDYLMSLFYEIAEQNGIKQYTESEDGSGMIGDE